MAEDVSIGITLEGSNQLIEGLGKVTEQLSHMAKVSEETASKLTAPFRAVQNIVTLVQTALVATGIERFISGFIQAGIQVDNLATRFSLLTGSLEKGQAAIKAVDDFAVKTGIAMNQLNAGAATLLRVAKNTDDLNKLLSETAALAQVTGKQFDDTASILTRAFQLGSTGARQLLRDGTGAMLGLQVGVKYTGEQIRIAFEKAMNDSTKPFIAATILMTQSWGNMVGRLTNLWENFKEDVMTSGLFDFLKAGLSVVVDYVIAATGNSKQFAETVSTLVIGAIKGATLAAAALYDQLVAAFTAMKPIADILNMLSGLQGGSGMPKTWQEFIYGPSKEQLASDAASKAYQEKLDEYNTTAADGVLTPEKREALTKIAQELQMLGDAADEAKAKLDAVIEKPTGTVAAVDDTFKRIDLQMDIMREDAVNAFKPVTHGLQGIPKDGSAGEAAIKKLRGEIEELLKSTQDPWVKFNEQVDKLTKGLKMVDPATGKALVTTDQYNHALVNLREAAEKATAELIDLNGEMDKEQKTIDAATDAINAHLTPLEKYRKAVHDLTQPGMFGQEAPASHMNDDQVKRSIDQYNKDLADQAVTFAETLTPAALQYTATVNELTKAYANQTIGLNDYVYGIQAAKAELAGITDLQQTLAQTAGSVFDQMQSVATAFFSSSKEGWAALKKMALDVLNAIIKKLMELMIINPLLNALSGGTGSQLPTLNLGSLLGLGGGSATGAGGASSMFGASGGGGGILSFLGSAIGGIGSWLGFASGTDSTFSSPTMIRVGESGPERVRVDPLTHGVRPEGGSGQVIIMDLRYSNGTDEIDQRIQKALRTVAPQLVNASVQSVKARTQRDPKFSQRGSR